MPACENEVVKKTKQEKENGIAHGCHISHNGISCLEGKSQLKPFVYQDEEEERRKMSLNPFS